MTLEKEYRCPKCQTGTRLPVGHLVGRRRQGVTKNGADIPTLNLGPVARSSEGPAQSHRTGYVDESWERQAPLIPHWRIFFPRRCIRRTQRCGASRRSRVAGGWGAGRWPFRTANPASREWRRIITSRNR